jgi:ammonia channel protein AmtB
MFEYGAVNPKNSDTVLIKNVFVIAMSCVQVYLIGYSEAYGDILIADSPGYVMSIFRNDEENLENHYMQWLLLFAVNAMVTNLAVSGMNERASSKLQILYSICVCFFIFPIIFGWITDGFLSYGGDISDHNGASYIHFLSGMCSFWGAYYIKARLGRYDPLVIRKVLDMDKAYIATN